MTQARWTIPLAIALTACGGAKKKPADVAEEPIAHEGDTTSAQTGQPTGTAPGTSDETSNEAPKATSCTGFEMDLMNALIQSACEVPNAKPEDKPRDLKKVLQVTAMATSNKVAPGGHVDVVVTFTNKSQSLLPLDFQIDPMPRFQVEAYTAKGNRRVDMPAGKPPKLPEGTPPREPGTPSTARITLAANGKAFVKIGWDASRMRWAPEKLKGTPPEQGYPRVASGPLPKGKYVLKVVTPLIGVFEGVEHELSAPKAPIEVGN